MDNDESRDCSSRFIVCKSPYGAAGIWRTKRGDADYERYNWLFGVTYDGPYFFSNIDRLKAHLLNEPDDALAIGIHSASHFIVCPEFQMLGVNGMR